MVLCTSSPPTDDFRLDGMTVFFFFITETVRVHSSVVISVSSASESDIFDVRSNSNSVSTIFSTRIDSNLCSDYFCLRQLQTNRQNFVKTFRFSQLE